MTIDQIPSDELSSDEHELLRQLLLMTGREDRPRRSYFDVAALPRIRTLLPKLQSTKENGSARTRRTMLNGLLRCLNIKTVSQEFFNTIFGDTNFSDIDEVAQKIAKFRIVCMLDYGNFRFGYKQLRRHDALIKQKWSSYFPSTAEASDRESKYQARPTPKSLIQIQPGELFALGNFERLPLDSINSARESLRRIFNEALEGGIDDFEELKRVKAAKKVGKLTFLIAQAGLPRAHELLDCPNTREHSFKQVLTTLLKNCDHIDKNGIYRVQEVGRKNAKTYMETQDLDVYVATSMRTPLHFATNWAFVNNLFHTEPLRSWNLNYFDPTRTYLQSRIQMGLLEFLMIKRTRLTVYHAQESDTFGKDCEAGVTLAHRKPVVVYVTRLLDRQKQMMDLYRILDAASTHRDRCFIHLREEGLLTKKQFESLLSDPFKTQADALEIVFREHMPAILKKIGDDRVDMEMIRQGYAPRENDEMTLAVDSISKLERRALTFRAHPLALQASPKDGVARGVIVTRTVADTAAVVSGILGDTLTYEIVEDLEDWLLVDTVTRSPVRVVTKDPMLTSAFWSEKWGSEE
jgi:hypothetical protein